jgi:hypothetical protein
VIVSAVESVSFWPFAPMPPRVIAHGPGGALLGIVTGTLICPDPLAVVVRVSRLQTLMVTVDPAAKPQAVTVTVCPAAALLGVTVVGHGGVHVAEPGG